MKKYIVLADQVVVSGSAFMFTVLLSRLFGLAVTGEYALFLITIQFLLICQTAYVINPMMTNLVQVELYSRVNLILIVVLSLVLFVLSKLDFLPVTYSDIKTDVLAFLFTPICMMLFEFVRRSYFYKGIYVAALLFDCLRCLLLLGGLLSISHFDLFTDYNMTAIYALQSISYALPLLIIIPNILSNFTHRKKKEISLIDVKKSLQHSSQLIISGGINWSLSNFAYLAIGYLFGNEKLGLVRTIQNLTGLFNIVYQSLENIFPKAISARFRLQGSEIALIYTFQIALKLGGIISICAIFLSIFSNDILKFVYERSFTDDRLLINSMLFYSFSSFFTFPLSYYFRAINSVKFILFSDIISLAFFSFLILTVSQNLHMEMLIMVMVVAKLTQVSMMIFYAVKYNKTQKKVNNFKASN